MILKTNAYEIVYGAPPITDREAYEHWRTTETRRLPIPVDLHDEHCECEAHQW